jgi:CSLREA domain-containing protein/uncharacterized repeat protein (TIGR01451 family)
MGLRAMIYVIAAGLMLAGGSASAATIVVSTIADTIASDGECSLREAIINANNGDQSGSTDCASGSAGADLIVFDAGLAGQTLQLGGSQLPVIISSMHIEGPVAGEPDQLLLDADGQSRLFEISGTVTVHIQDLTLSGGHTTAPNAQGGAVRVVDGASLTLERMIISGNTTERSGGHGGGVYVADGKLEIIDSRISGNRAMVLVSNGGGIAAYNSEVSVVRSLIHDNESVHSSGGGMFVDGGPLSLVNSTISGNKASSTGGLMFRGSDAVLLHSTLAFNLAGTGTGVQDVFVSGQSDSPATLALNYSLIVQSEDRQTCHRLTNAHTTLTAEGSLSTHSSCTGVATPLELIRLGSLADNGGYTRSHGLGLGSVAIDAAGDCPVLHGLDEDQRGLPRPGGNSDTCDVGAFEQQEPPPESDLALTVGVEPEQADVSDNVVFSLVAANLGPDLAPNVAVDAPLPAGFHLVSDVADIGHYDAGLGMWMIGDLAAGDDASLTIEATVTAVRDYRLQAAVGSPAFDPDLGNNAASARVWLLPATLVVTTVEDIVADDGECSLREAIINTNHNDQSGSSDCASGNDFDRIEFAPHLTGGRIVLDGTVLPAVSHPLQIAGPLAGDPTGMTIDGDAKSRLFTVSNPDGETRLELSDLVLTRARSTTGAALSVGSAATSWLERVRVTDSEVVDSSTFGGALYATNDAHLMLVDSEVSANRAPGTWSRGGGLVATGGATLSLIRSTVENNQARRQGGGIYLRFADLNLVNSTVSGNQAGSEGGGGIFAEGGTVYLRHATVADNVIPSSSSNAGAIQFEGSESDPVAVVVENSLIVQSGTSACATPGPHTDLQSSLSVASDASCTGQATAEEAIGLGPLADHGAIGRMHALPETSVARDVAGDCTDSGGPDHDQRGMSRPGLMSGGCDAGAYEYQFDKVFRDHFQLQ